MPSKSTRELSNLVSYLDYRTHQLSQICAENRLERLVLANMQAELSHCLSKLKAIQIYLEKEGE